MLCEKSNGIKTVLCLSARFQMFLIISRYVLVCELTNAIMKRDYADCRRKKCLIIQTITTSRITRATIPKQVNRYSNQRCTHSLSHSMQQMQLLRRTLQVQLVRLLLVQPLLLM